MAGLFVPLELLPDAASDILSVLRPGLLGSAIQHDLTGMPALQPTWVAWLGAVGSGALLTLIASLTFRWDDGER